MHNKKNKSQMNNSALKELLLSVFTSLIFFSSYHFSYKSGKVGNKVFTLVLLKPPVNTKASPKKKNPQPQATMLIEEGKHTLIQNTHTISHP